MSTKLIHVGFGNLISIDKVIAVAVTESAPTKRSVLEARAANRLIDLTNGRRTKSVIYMENGQIVLSAIATDTIHVRYQPNNKED